MLRNLGKRILDLFVYPLPISDKEFIEIETPEGSFRIPADRFARKDLDNATDGSVIARLIATGAVTRIKLADDSVDMLKLSPEVRESLENMIVDAPDSLDGGVIKRTGRLPVNVEGQLDVSPPVYVVSQNTFNTLIGSVETWEDAGLFSGTFVVVGVNEAGTEPLSGSAVKTYVIINGESQRDDSNSYVTLPSALAPSGGLDYSGGLLRITPLSVTSGMLAGDSITNSKMADDNVAFRNLSDNALAGITAIVEDYTGYNFFVKRITDPSTDFLEGNGGPSEADAAAFLTNQWWIVTRPMTVSGLGISYSSAVSGGNLTLSQGDIITRNSPDSSMLYTVIRTVYQYTFSSWLTNESHTFAVDENSNVPAGEETSTRLVIARGDSIINEQYDTWSIVTPGGVTASLVSTGALRGTLNDVTFSDGSSLSSAAITINASDSSGVLPPISKVFSISKAQKGTEGSSPPGLVFRGEFDGARKYRFNDNIRDVTSTGLGLDRVLWVANNVDKSGLTTWSNPGENSDWLQFGTVTDISTTIRDFAIKFTWVNPTFTERLRLTLEKEVDGVYVSFSTYDISFEDPVTELEVFVDSPGNYRYFFESFMTTFSKKTPLSDPIAVAVFSTLPPALTAFSATPNRGSVDIAFTVPQSIPHIDRVEIEKASNSDYLPGAPIPPGSSMNWNVIASFNVLEGGTYSHTDGDKNSAERLFLYRARIIDSFGNEGPYTTLPGHIFSFTGFPFQEGTTPNGFWRMINQTGQLIDGHWDANWFSGNWYVQDSYNGHDGTVVGSGGNSTGPWTATSWHDTVLNQPIPGAVVTEPSIVSEPFSAPVGYRSITPEPHTEAISSSAMYDAFFHKIPEANLTIDDRVIIPWTPDKYPNSTSRRALPIFSDGTPVRFFKSDQSTVSDDSSNFIAVTFYLKRDTNPFYTDVDVYQLFSDEALTVPLTTYPPSVWGVCRRMVVWTRSGLFTINPANNYITPNTPTGFPTMTPVVFIPIGAHANFFTTDKIYYVIRREEVSPGDPETFDVLDPSDGMNPLVFSGANAEDYRMTSMRKFLSWRKSTDTFFSHTNIRLSSALLEPFRMITLGPERDRFGVATKNFILAYQGLQLIVVDSFGSEKVLNDASITQPPLT